MSRYFIPIALVLLLISIKPTRRFSIRAISGVLLLFVISILNIGVAFNYIGIATSTLLGIPGALSFIAISYIL